MHSQSQRGGISIGGTNITDEVQKLVAEYGKSGVLEGHCLTANTFSHTCLLRSALPLQRTATTSFRGPCSHGPASPTAPRSDISGRLRLDDTANHIVGGPLKAAILHSQLEEKLDTHTSLLRELSCAPGRVSGIRGGVSFFLLLLGYSVLVLLSHLFPVLLSRTEQSGQVNILSHLFKCGCGQGIALSMGSRSTRSPHNHLSMSGNLKRKPFCAIIIRYSHPAKPDDSSRRSRHSEAWGYV